MGYMAPGIYTGRREPGQKYKTRARAGLMLPAPTKGCLCSILYSTIAPWTAVDNTVFVDMPEDLDEWETSLVSVLK